MFRESIGHVDKVDSGENDRRNNSRNQGSKEEVILEIPG